MSNLNYRPDIDGLRAVAVIAVVLFHAFPTILPGGFIGVDIFFVISGYLITSIIMKDIANGTFTLSGFYARRVRRLFPALLLVIAATIAVGLFLLVTESFLELVLSALAALGFVVNVLFWTQAGYTDVSAATKPLLHLWSLSVEEQYYLIWPLLLLATSRWRFGALAVGLAVLASTFAMSVYYTPVDQAGAYYLPFTRLWEPMAGSLLAMLRFQPGRRLYAEGLSIVGTTLLAASFVLIDDAGSFPGWRAALPVSAATLLIAAGPSAIVNRWLLATKPVVAVGLISYPLYLWHWPALVYAKYLELIDTGHFQISNERASLAIAVAVILAFATYLLVERPVQRTTWRYKNSSLVAGWGLALAAMAFVWLSGPLIGLKVQKSEDDYLAELSRRDGQCFLMDKAVPLAPGCIVPDDDRRSVLLVGDSYAAGFSKPLRENPKVALSEYTSSSCPFNVGYNTFVRPDECRAINDARFKLILERNFDTIFIASWWNQGGDIEQLDNLASTIETILERTTSEIVLYGPSPRYGSSVPEIYLRQMAASGVYSEVEPVFLYVEERERLQRILPKSERLRIIDPFAIFCRAQLCDIRDSTDLYFLDAGHLSLRGVETVLSRTPDLSGG